MNPLDVVSTLLDEIESQVAADVAVKTSDSGDYEVPAVLMKDFSAQRIQTGNDSARPIKNINNQTIGKRLWLKFSATAVIRTESYNEVESYQLAQTVYDWLAWYESDARALHEDVNEFSLRKVAKVKPQVETPEHAYRHSLTCHIDFNHYVEITDDRVGEPIEEIIENVYTLD